MLASLALVITTVVNDMLYANDLIRTGHYIPYGLLFFVFSQAMILANRSAKAFQGLESTNAAYQLEIRERERAEAEVKAYQERLEDLVRERTDALAEANHRLKLELDDRKTAGIGEAQTAGTSSTGAEDGGPGHPGRRCGP